MEFDLKKPYCYYFNEICAIPHGSYNEKAVSDYVVSFAQEHGLEYVQDQMNNVIVRKPASEGYEDYDPVMLQGHMDMVCEKQPGVEFDFMNHGIETYVDEEGKLRAKGTTLGADDGMGVAEMLAILADNTLAHPALDCVFTVQEEVGLLGALGMDKSLLRAHRMISLDGGGETCTTISSAGGVNAIVTIPVRRRECTKPVYSLKVTGLSGGHSGAEIHKEKGNANKLVSRICKEMICQGIDVSLIRVDGGSKDNAICRESVIVFASHTEKAIIEETAAALQKKISVEFEVSDPDFTVIVENSTADLAMMDDDSTRRVIDYMYLCPNGFRHKSMAIEGLTLTSLNMGVVRTDEHAVVVNSSIRSALEEAIDDLIDTLKCLSSYMGGKVETFARYPGWNYNPDSKMRETYQKVLQEVDGVELECHAVHGGLECAVFTQIEGGMDIITCGPKSGACHTPDEWLDLESWDRTWKILTGIIAQVEKKA
ncbi:MAG: beta-Ala-His dipeptidase [Bulleidia sp.]